MMQRYGNRESFLTTFNPGLQREICTSPDNCFWGDHPTLDGIREAYGHNSPVMFLVAQLLDLSEYSGCRNKITDRQLEECAFVIAGKFGYLKVSELMLFFYEFKAGEYGDFYGAVSPLRITTALQEFLRKRREAYERRRRRGEEEAREREQEESARNATTWEQYCKDMETQLRAEGKDEEADKWVNRPHPLSRFSTEDLAKPVKKALARPAPSMKVAKMLVQHIAEFTKEYGMTPQEYIKRHEVK